MTQPRRGGPAFPARFDTLAFDEDLAHSGPGGRRAATHAREQIERDGIPTAELHR